MLAEGCASFRERWVKFCQDELANKTKSRDNSQITKTRRRVKPTLVTHIGLPITNTSFRPIEDKDPVMKLDMRKLRIGNKNELFEDASKESLNLDPAQKPAKAGNPIIRVDPDNEKKIIQSVGYLVKNSGKSFNLHLKLLEILFGLLGTLHQIFPDTDCPTSNLLGTSFIAISDFSASVTGLNFLFEDPSLSIFFGMELFKALFRRICKFTPSFLPFLETNNCLRKMCPKVFVKADRARNSQSRDSFVGLTGLLCQSNRPKQEQQSLEKDAFDSIAYVDRRDSRNYNEQAHLHANQQKARDAFLELIRQTGADFVPAFVDKPFSNNPPLGDLRKELVSRVRDVLGKLNVENFSWFADLLIYQYEQIRKRNCSSPFLDQGRLCRLEERFTRSLSSSNKQLTSDPRGNPDDQRNRIETNIVAQFLTLADSHRLHVQVSRRLWKLIDEAEFSYISGNRSGNSEELAKLCHLAGLIAHLDGLVDEYQSDLIYRITDAYTKGYLLIRLPWILSYLRGIPSSNQIFINTTVFLGMLSKRYASEISDFSRPDLYLYLLLENYVSTYSQVIPKESKDISFPPTTYCVESDSFHDRPLPLDVDAAIDLDLFMQTVSSTYANLFVLLKNITRTPTTTTTSNSNSPTESPIFEIKQATRKIRPIKILEIGPKLSAANKSADLPKWREDVQRKLRHWYWWQWPDFKEVSDSILRYALTLKATQIPPEQEAGKLIQIEHIRLILESALPGLMPPILKENQRALNVATALILEKAYDMLN